ncbi:type VI secretion system baseplate subunit TssF [Jiella sp. MQZ9-1]|uniref:Type VI secretion system baseplate subunit TssF n=1 Tax=Jiella flava TaxID=2816857 RepID=A0A939FVE1_9HYPH|nr:type VI secretion system baseplate subunit TssF [Jiella flava]MBO0662663.1 type VI secretion system baseplate subunit TssF [Jiella flava]MCD2471085.1 type VI secretion system baseplate subunit TssF [Jiella flava]
MADFLAHYNEELDALRERAARFAKAFPKVAGRLRLTGEVADDPHVERLVQSFAFSAARVRQKLDDEFPELTSGLLETLYPHYLAPIPSMSVVRFQPGSGAAGVLPVPRHTEIQAEPINGESCRFRTSQHVEVAPVRLAAARLASQPIEAPASPHRGAASCLRLSLRPAGGANGIGEIGLSRLRFFLAGSWRQASGLAELLMNHTLGLALARHSSDPEPILLPKTRLRAVGFDADEGLLPYPPTSFSGYRLLTEFFALPQKFLFLEIDGLDAWAGKDLEIFVYLDESNSTLEQAVSAEDFVINATPVVNLFRQLCEPITLDGTRTEYRLIPDSRRQKSREIHSVTAVNVGERTGTRYPSVPFFGRTRTSHTGVYWQVNRQFSDDGSSDVDIAFVDENRRSTGPLDAVASVETLCLNRDLPESLPFGGGHPHLSLVDGMETIEAVEALVPPTPTVRLDEADGRNWRLMSHLLLNHLSLADQGGSALKDILKLYAFRDTPETRQLAGSIASIETTSATTRIQAGMVPGTEIALTFDPATIDRPSAYLFGAVLDRFFGLYTSINSYTRLTVHLRGQSRPVARFAPRAAERPLL